MSLANGFLPTTMEEVQELGIEQLDFIYVSGDAYVDHPSFGPAIITRVLHAHGYHVGIIAQPDWKNDDSITVLGTPRLGFLVSSGNMDSMVNHYFVSKKHRPPMLIRRAARWGSGRIMRLWYMETLSGRLLRMYR